MLNNNLTKISNIMSFSSDVPDQDPDSFFQIRIRPEPDPDFFFKLGSGRNRTWIFFPN